jgi:hypothetical protein
MDAPKSIRETEKSAKNPLVWAKKPKKPKKNPKNPKNPKKPKKPKKTQKKPTGLFFFKKTRVFSNPDPHYSKSVRIHYPVQNSKYLFGIGFSYPWARLQLLNYRIYR